MLTSVKCSITEALIEASKEACKTDSRSTCCPVARAITEKLSPECVAMVTAWNVQIVAAEDYDVLHTVPTPREASYFVHLFDGGEQNAAQVKPVSFEIEIPPQYLRLEDSPESLRDSELDTSTH